MEDKNRFVDQLLDSALANQRGAEPGAGFEGRILARVHAASRQNSPKRLWVAIAATAAAVLVFAAIYVANRSHRPAVQSPQVSKAAPLMQHKETLTAKVEAAPKAGEATTSNKAKSTAHRARKAPSTIEAHHWPSQFPTPAPLSPEEKALVQYVRDTPPEVLAASLFKEQSVNQPLETKPLKIAPLEIQPLSFGSTQEEMQ